MEVSVSSRHVEVSDQLREMTIQKIGRLDRFLSGLDHAEVHFMEEKNPRIADKEICEVTIEGHGHHVRVKVAAPDGFTAVDKAVDKLERSLRKLKTKLHNRHHPNPKRKRKGGTPPVDMGEAVPDEESMMGEEPPGGDAELLSESDMAQKIVKAKAFLMRPMSAEEAALQMDLLHHSFYFFRNAETGRSAVVYRREDGDIGLIDEES
ncbi:MAG: ribosome-associated translation inhibitor RaiA [Actinomycetia bacterium]|nr:ribosome-associated translation inhibitor RaiA [Actinomycetes bacterium]